MLRTSRFVLKRRATHARKRGEELESIDAAVRVCIECAKHLLHCNGLGCFEQEEVLKLTRSDGKTKRLLEPRVHVYNVLDGP